MLSQAAVEATDRVCVDRISPFWAASPEEPAVKRIPRPLTLAALALVIVPVAGCSEFSAQTTTLGYAPSDGVQADLADGVGVRNALFLASGKDAPGTMLAVIVNTGDKDASVKFSGEGLSDTVQVDAGQTVTIGPDGDEQVDVDRMGSVPGALVNVDVAVGSVSQTLRVPVLDGTLAEFDGLVPSASKTS